MAKRSMQDCANLYEDLALLRKRLLRAQYKANSDLVHQLQWTGGLVLVALGCDYIGVVPSGEVKHAAYRGSFPLCHGAKVGHIHSNGLACSTRASARSLRALIPSLFYLLLCASLSWVDLIGTALASEVPEACQIEIQMMLASKGDVDGSHLHQSLPWDAILRGPLMHSAEYRDAIMRMYAQTKALAKQGSMVPASLCAAICTKVTAWMASHSMRLLLDQVPAEAYGDDVDRGKRTS